MLCIEWHKPNGSVGVTVFSKKNYFLYVLTAGIQAI